MFCRFLISGSNQEKSFLTSGWTLGIFSTNIVQRSTNTDEYHTPQAPSTSYSDILYWLYRPVCPPFPRNPVEPVIMIVLPLKYPTTLSASILPIVSICVIQRKCPCIYLGKKEGRVMSATLPRLQATGTTKTHQARDPRQRYGPGELLVYQPGLQAMTWAQGSPCNCLAHSY
jgi:hypothetical protein